MPIASARALTVTSPPAIPRISPGDDLLDVLCTALADRRVLPKGPMDQDVVCVTSKLLSRAEDRFVDLSQVQPGPQAQRLAGQCDKDPRLVELILEESSAVSRVSKGVLIVRHRLGFVCANAGIDASNALPVHHPRGPGPHVLLLPRNPDKSARALSQGISDHFSKHIAVVITDSHSRAFRWGTVGVAIGCAGMPARVNHAGSADLDGRQLEHTSTALADQAAATADMVAGQGAEGRPVAVISGLQWNAAASPASLLYRTPAEDLYA